MKRSELTIDDLAFGGEGVGRVEGYVIFVRGALPGDRVRVRIVEARSRFGRGVIRIDRVPVRRSGRARRAPTSAAAAAAVSSTSRIPRSWRSRRSRCAIASERIGGLGDFELRPILAAPDPYGYRNKMEFTIVRPGAGDGPAIGLHQADRYDVVLDIDRCLLQSDTMNVLLDELRTQARARAAFRLRPATRARGSCASRPLREGRRTGEAMVNIVTAAPDVVALGPVAERLRARVPSVASVVLNVNAKKASRRGGLEEHLLLGRDHIRESLGGLTFQVSANSFFQTNTVQAERLFAVVEAACELTGRETVVDLYSGTGAISLLLARRCRCVYGIEVAPAAVADAVRNARENGIENCTFLPGEVRHVLPTLTRDGVRAGGCGGGPAAGRIPSQGAQALATLGPERLVYVSCNPSTLARDVGDLVRQGYRLEWVEPVDMFPQTPHIEAVARLHRAP